MPKRRRYTTLTRRDIEGLTNPLVLMIFVGIASGGMVFIVGIFLIILFASWLHNSFGLSSEFTFDFSVFSILALVVLTLVLTIAISVILINKYNKAVEKKYRGLLIANIDLMAGIEFEQYLKRVLASQGYSVNTTVATGDLGVDLVALSSEGKIAIQAKRQHNKVSRRAISDAVAGMYHYGCSKAMVITNSYFSPGAITLARSTGCILIDRDTLAKWVIDYQVASSVLSE